MIDSFRAWERGHPIPVATGIVLVFVVWFLLPSLLAGTQAGGGQALDGLSDMARMVWDEAALVAAVLVLALLVGNLRAMHIRSAPRWRALWFLLPVLAYLALFLSAGLAKLAELPPGSGSILGLLLPSVLATTLLVGLFEEVLFRGILFRGLRRGLGPVAAFFASSLIFGAMHYVNWVGGQPLGDTHVQVIHAAAAGLLYCAVMLVANSIWPAVFLHGAWDCIVAFNQTVQGLGEATLAPASAPTLLSAAIYGFEPLYGLLLFAIWFRYWRR